jgi:thiamine pyrophosphokinase
MAATAVIYVNGDGGPQAVPPLGDVTVSIAADAGLHLARRLDHHVDVLVGDLDSVLPTALEEARSSGVDVDRHDPDKDETDLELALDHALRLRPDRLVVLGGGGGRLDHLVAILAALTAPRLAAIDVVEAYLGQARVDVVRGRRELKGRAGLLVSLLAWGGPATGVTTSGLRWPLAAATLAPGSALGTSNEFLDDAASVVVESGVLTAITPDVSPIHPIVDLDPR